MPVLQSDSITRIMGKHVANTPSPVPEAKYLHQALVDPHSCLGFQGQCLGIPAVTKAPGFLLTQKTKGLL